MTDQTLRLHDGRILAYSQWGDAQGPPVFWFHGTPHSRLWCPDEGATRAAGARLISPDRPGVGGSDPKPGRRIGDWPEDVLELARALDVERFAVVGCSGGGVYAAACAAKISARLTSVGIVSSRLGQWAFAERPDAYQLLDPDDRKLFDLAQTDPDAAANAAASRIEEWVRKLTEAPESAYHDFEITSGDRWFFDDELRLRGSLAAIQEAVRQGAEAFASETIDVFLPWGFRLDEIPIEVHIWHGDEDTRVPRKEIEWLAERIPRTRLTVWPDAGHYAVAKHWSEILEVLIA